MRDLCWGPQLCRRAYDSGVKHVPFTWVSVAKGHILCVSCIEASDCHFQTYLCRCSSAESVLVVSTLVLKITVTSTAAATKWTRPLRQYNEPFTPFHFYDATTATSSALQFVAMSPWYSSPTNASDSADRQYNARCSIQIPKINPREWG